MASHHGKARSQWAFFQHHIGLTVYAGIFSLCAHLIEAKKQEEQDSSKNASLQRENYEDNDDDDWKNLELPDRVWVYVVCGVVAFWVFLSLFLAFCCGPRFVECHLCEEPIPKRQWNQLDHWDACAKDHERFLQELPETENKCPSCGNALKIWPKGVGPNVFKCRLGVECDPNKRHKNGSPVVKKNLLKDRGKLLRKQDCFDVANDGSSRFVCFKDGYDICNKCASEELSQLSQMTATTTASSLNTTCMSSGSKQLNGGWFDVQLKTISQHVQEKTDNNGVAMNGKVIVVQS